MERDETVVRRVSQLADIEKEYDMTVRVLAVLVERLQHLTGAREIQISDAAVADQPDLSAYRNETESSISLSTIR